ncbi:MAG TPA: hypothetical protein V6D14_09700 [Coleofasciculaceae cyanobacterium]
MKPSSPTSLRSRGAEPAVIDLGDKKRGYRRNGIRAYIVLLRLGIEEGRRMKAEGSYVTPWKGILTPANWEPPNRRFARGLIPLLPWVVGFDVERSAETRSAERQRTKAFLHPPA